MWLVACEYTGTVRDALIRQGHPAISCDLWDSEKPGPHIKGDVREVLQRPWSGIIAHPPCTRLCLSGVRWLAERDLWADLEEGIALFKACQAGNAPLIAIENPQMHSYAQMDIGPPNFSIQPWMFGDDYKKKTCFWTKGLPPLQPTSILDGTTAKAEVHSMAPSKTRGHDRSRTYPGLAEAIATQWGPLA